MAIRRVRVASILTVAAIVLLALLATGRRRVPDHLSAARRAQIERVQRPRLPNQWFMRQRLSGDTSLEPRVRARARARARGVAGATDGAPGTWVNVGPVNIGGRITTLAVDPNDPDRIWAGAAAGGVWSSTDGGVTWVSVFDDQTAQSIGSLAAHPVDSNVLYVGTGEDNGAGYSYDGEGVFKTTDGGQTWINVGLASTRRIGGIAIDPVDPERIFVAAGGDAFRPGPDRGVYRSTDGGQTWSRVLFVADDTGAIDVQIDPSDPNRVYVALWTRLSGDTNITFGGPDSGIWQSLDGGDTWSELTVGLPTTDLGRIGLAIAPSSPNVVYARYQNENGPFKGIWRSDDSGATWNRTDVAGGLWRLFLAGAGYYFGEIRVDPADADTVFLLDAYWFDSTDGGATFREHTSGLHVDHQDLVIQASGRWLMATDGGFYSSTNRGKKWTHALTMPISQVYDIAIDRLQPQRRFLGLQDNGTVRTVTAGVDDWTEVFGGDGMQTEVDPTDSDYVYASSQGGGIGRSTNGGRSFVDAIDGIDPTERTNWNSPLTHDPLTHLRLYTGTERVYRSVDGAVSWSPISPTLTDRTDGPGLVVDKQRLADYRSHLADLVRGTVSAIGVSPLDTDIVWAGTDDGNVWVTADGGAGWQRVDVPGRTEWVTRLTADPFDTQTAYVTFSGFRNGSRLPHVHRTTDLGQTWTDISGNLPDVPLNDVEPDPEWEGRLFVGSDLGVFVTDSRGLRWDDMNGGMPIVVVQDLVLHQETRVLYAGTHGRSLWSFDLEQLPVPDRDLDGWNDLEDCAPDDGGVFAAPAEVTNLGFDTPRDLSWNSAVPGAGSSTVHDVVRGDLAGLPVGAGTGETCLASGLAAETVQDPAVPLERAGYWYLVRARNVCGIGTWGFAPGGAERMSGGCP